MSDDLQHPHYILYGIKNCDTIKKARRWLDEQQVDYRFHDYRTDGISASLLAEFTRRCDWRTLLNTRGTTWRKLSDEQRLSAATVDNAQALMLSQPALIKRPVLQAPDGAILVGFYPLQYQQFIAKEA
ncbi:ArsC family reductase [Biostraticola tofi]|uniref:Spx/MgsR family transcriptional regulator n=1 Tax=Biostraticola tofi TaxID=466109 RepID=A0A4R3YMB0_9GAMM|nr:ArsC family reductase [Biostraticola tofi]TCV91963.1 Spx/MgsR family transcriptional regulator [Biostraticola tofi]